VSDIEFDLIICSEFNKKRPWQLEFFNYGENKRTALNAIGITRAVRTYSDHKSDMPIMEMADEQVWIDPVHGTRIEK